MATAGQTSKVIYDSNRNSFAIGTDGKVLINGVVDSYTDSVDRLVVSDGSIYQTAPDPATGDATESWWEYTPGSGWHNWTKVASAPIASTITDATDLSPPIPSPSAEGTKTSTVGTVLYDSHLNALSINADHKLVVNGEVDTNTNNVMTLEAHNGSVYQGASSAGTSGAVDGWWQFTPGAGWNNWSATAGDPLASTTTPPASSGSTSGGTTTTTPPVTQPTTPSTPTSSGSDGKFPASWSRLDNGVNIERSQIPSISDSELKKLAASGVENIRMFMSPDDGYLTHGKAMDPEHSSYVKAFADFMHRVNDAGMAVVISPFGGLTRQPWASNPSDQASINETANWYKEFAGYIANHFKPTDVFIESQNEPFMSDPSAWWKIEDQFIKAVHSVAPDFTFVSSASGLIGSDWSFIDSLTPLTPHADKNVVYNVHYYEPMTFTHQGQTWMGSYWGNLKNIQYTSQDGADTAAKFDKLAAWADKFGVKITVNEFGSSQTAAESERAEFAADVRANADKHDFGWDVWDFDKGFSISTTDSSGDEVVKDIFQKALEWGKYQVSTTTASTTTSSTPVTTTPTSTTTSSTTTSTQPVTLTKTLDAQFAISEKIAFTSADLGKNIIVNNFDPQSGKVMIQDAVDISDIFNKLGGKYTDGVNDVADRIAAVHLTAGDFNGDGKANDLKMTIAGVDNFSLTFANPSTNDKALYEVNDHTHVYDNIWIA